ncbi:uncharacterized protein LOC144452619 [Glandiceps talaboti]
MINIKTLVCVLSIFVYITESANLVAFWPLDKDFNLQDTSGNGNHGAAVGASLVADAQGTRTGAYNFAGNGNSYIEFPNNGAYDTQYSITLLAYIYPTGNSGPIFNFKRDGWGAHMWQTAPTQHFARFVRRNLSFTTALAVNVLTQNAWNFVGASYNYNTGEAKLWLNGNVVQTMNIGVTTIATQYEARMGARIGDGRYYRGMITCMQVYNQELTPAEMIEAEAKCNIGIVEETPSLVAFWPLDKDFNLQDTSGNGNHGSTVGASLVANAQGTRTGAYNFAGNANSYIEFPNNGAYDTQYSITLLAYIYPTGSSGPIFNFKRDGWGAHMWQTAPTQHFARFVRRGLSFTTALAVNVLTQNAWNFVGASYNYNTGEAKLWLNGNVVQTMNIGVTTIATQYEARMGARIGDGRYYSGMITCMQVYDQELTPAEMIEAEAKCNIGVEPTPTEVIEETSGLVAFWPLDKDFNLQDTSGNGNHGSTVGASLVADAQGTRTGAYNFAGNANSYIEFPNNGAYDTQYSITLLAYIYPTGSSGPIFNFKRDGWGAHMWQTAPTQHFARFVRRNLSFTTYLAVNVLTQNAWNFVGASYNYNTGEAKLWLNGNVVQTMNIGVTTIATQYEARMGARIGDGRYYRGMITCMQVYNKELSVAEVQVAEAKCKIGEAPPTTVEPTTEAPTTLPPTTVAPTTLPPTTVAPTTLPPATTLEATTYIPTLPPCEYPVPLRNVATNKPVCQSSTKRNWYAEKAVDGNYNSDMKKGKSCTQTKKEYEPFWQLDLQQTEDVYEIAITNRMDCCSGRLKTAEIRVGDSIEIEENPVCGEMILGRMVKDEPIIIRCGCETPMKGRYVSIALVDKKEMLHLCEVEVRVG